MTIPIQVGLPQVILFIVGIVGLFLLISAVMGMRRRSVGRYADYEDEEEARKFGRPRRRRYFRWGRAIGGIILVLLALSILWLALLIQTYLGLTGDVKVAQVRAHTIANLPHEMSVELILYDKNGHQSSDQTYAVNGDEWMLQGDMIKFPAWLNIVGLHSGYKLTRLEGRFDDPKLESNAKHVVITLNGGDDNFFKTVHDQRSWTAPFVDAAYGNAVFVPADGTYDVFVSQTGLWAKHTG